MHRVSCPIEAAGNVLRAEGMAMDVIVRLEVKNQLALVCASLRRF